MAEAWDKKVFEFLKKTGEEIKTETQRLIEEVKDPEKQAKIKTGLKDLSVWAKKTAEEAAELVEGAYRKAEETVRSNVPGPKPEARSQRSAPAADSAPRAPASKPAPPAKSAPRADAKAGAKADKKPAAKTVGKKPASGAAKPKAKAAKKTLGKKPGSGSEQA